LGLLKGRAFKKTELFETREGICRVMPTITKQLMTIGPAWAKELGPVVESVALKGCVAILAGSAGSLQRR
jgi:hypothetical protein